MPSPRPAGHLPNPPQRGIGHAVAPGGLVHRDRARKAARRRNLLQLLEWDGSGKTSIGGRREKPNHWRAITRLEAAVQVAH